MGVGSTLVGVGVHVVVGGARVMVGASVDVGAGVGLGGSPYTSLLAAGTFLTSHMPAATAAIRHTTAHAIPTTRYHFLFIKILFPYPLMHL